MGRSLKVSPGCIEQVKSALARNGFPSQKALAEELEIGPIHRQELSGG
jgi:hypothetical protein